MSDITLSEYDEEFYIAETPATDAIVGADDGEDGEDGEDGDDDEDTRLADEEDGEEGDASPNRKKRLKRRQVQKIAKENAQRELRLLREQNEAMARRLAAVEGNALDHNVLAIDTRLTEAQREVRQAEQIIARAIEAGNGDDVTLALKMRDEALRRSEQLQGVKVQVQHAKNAPAGPDPRVKSRAQEWMEANSWYDPAGRDEDSAVTNAIDSRLVAEGYNPAERKYWKELTKRVSNRIGADEPSAGGRGEDAPSRKKAPPMGNTREHAPMSTKKEVHVTPARKQAMIEAGIWEDPVRRNQMLKAYQAYDRNSAR